MTTIEFYFLVSQNIYLYITLWAIIFFCYRLLFLQNVKSILDPIYFFIIFTNSICTANVSFLGIVGEVHAYYIAAYFFSEFALLAGILLLSKPKALVSNFAASKGFDLQLNIGMSLTIFVALCTSVLIYIDRGIPILLDSRGDASGGGTGFGFVSRLSQVAAALFVLLFFIKSKITNSTNSIYDYSMLMMSVIIGVLSGYKAFFLFYLYAYFVTRSSEELPNGRREIYIIIISLVLMISLFSLINGSADIELVLISLLTRIIASGDVYYMAFVDDTINKLDSSGFVYQMFGGLLASVRLIGWDHAPQNLGYALNQVLMKNDMNLGPTFRYNVLWLLLTGSMFLTALFSFITGLIVGYFNGVLNKKIRSAWAFIFISFFYYKSFLLILGPDNAISDMVLSLFILLFLVVIIKLFANGLKNKI